jgi:hypothetical protein
MARRRQEELSVTGPGVSPPRLKEVEDAADAYVDARDRRMKLTVKESEAKLELATLLHKHAEAIGVNPDDGSIRYSYDGGEKAKRVIVLKPSDEKLKVKDVEEFEEVDV